MSEGDVRCGILQDAMAQDGGIEQAIRQQFEIDRERVDRLLLASLNDDTEARQFAMDGIPSCQACYRALIMMLASEHSTKLEHYYNPDMDPNVDGRSEAIRNDHRAPDEESGCAAVISIPKPIPRGDTMSTYPPNPITR